jgi:hypothetical protein
MSCIRLFMIESVLCSGPYQKIVSILHLCIVGALA